MNNDSHKTTALYGQSAVVLWLINNFLIYYIYCRNPVKVLLYSFSV